MAIASFFLFVSQMPEAFNFIFYIFIRLNFLQNNCQVFVCQLEISALVQESSKACFIYSVPGSICSKMKKCGCESEISSWLSMTVSIHQLTIHQCQLCLVSLYGVKTLIFLVVMCYLVSLKQLYAFFESRCNACL